MRKFASALLCCLLCIFMLTGCGSQISFTWVVDHVPANLDPQLASFGPELVAAYNLYSGLVRLDENGDPQPECAESWTESSDGLTYTFKLKDGLHYEKLRHHEKEYPLTASDFVFAFQRVFLPETNSPFAASFSAIQNSREVLTGAVSPSALGVSAPDDHTVVFHLEKPDPKFLSKLALPGAMPCNKEFFEDTKGAYGLMAHGSAFKNVLANGPFRLYNWNENGLFLRRPENGQLFTSLRIVLNSTSGPADDSGNEPVPLTGADLLRAGKATAALSDTFEDPDFSAIPYTATTWALTFNCEQPQLAQPKIRQALASSAQNADLTLAKGCQAAEGFIPPAVSVLGNPYRSDVGPVIPHFEDPVTLCRDGFAQTEAKRFESISIMIPQGYGVRDQAEALNQEWQKQLGAYSAFFPIRELPIEEYTQKLMNGDYQIALVPFSPLSDNAAEMLSQISITNPTTGQTPGLLRELDHAAGWSASQLAQTEAALLNEATVMPLWTQSKSLLVQPGVKGLIFRPFGPVLDLTWATLSQ